MLTRTARRARRSHRQSRPRSHSRSEPHWVAMLPNEQWTTYQRAIQALRSAGLKFLVGGGFALANYTRRWRNTKDIDFYVMPDERQAAIQALTEAQFEDYHTKLAYDRGWIYRSTAEGVIVDIIWSMANRRAAVDDEWFERAPLLKIRDEKLQILPVEELLWSKLYVLQHDHCDWPDVLNLLYACGPRLDWKHLLRRVNGDILLLKAMGTLFDWLCPDHPERIPSSVRAELQLTKPQSTLENHDFDRVRLLDSRQWFAAAVSKDKQLEI